MEAGYVSQTKAVNNLTLALEKLEKAQRVANTYSAAATAAGGAVPRLSKGAKQQADQKSAEANFQRARDTMLMRAKGPDANTPGKLYYGNEMGFNLSNIERDRRAMNLLHEEALAMDKAMGATAVQTERVKKGLSAAAVGGAALSAGMLLTMTNSNETANSNGNMLILGTFVVPSAIALAGALKVAYGWAKGISIATALTAARTKATAAWTAATAVASERWALAMAAGNRGGIVGALSAAPRFLAMMVNPIGLIAAGVTAVGVGIWAWKKHLEKVREEQAKYHMDLNNLTDAWAKNVGAVKREYQGLAMVQKDVKTQTQYERDLSAYKSGDLTSQRDAFAKAQGSERFNAAADTFTSLQADYGYTAEQAATNLRALYEAAGLGAQEADAAITKLMKDFGDVQMGTGQQLTVQAQIYWNQEENSKEAADAAKDVGEAFVQEFTSATSGSQAMGIINQLKDIVNQGWTGAWEDIASSSDSTLANALKSAGIKTGDELRNAIGEAGGMENLITELFPDAQGGTWNMMYTQLVAAANAATVAEGQLVGAVSEQLPGVDDSVDSVYELTDSVQALQVQAKAIDLDRMRSLIGVLANPRPAAMVNSLLPGLDGLGKTIYTAADGEELFYANTLLAAQGLGHAETMAEAVAIASGAIAPKIDNATSAARGLGSALKSASFDASNVASMWQDAMSATQQMVADDYSSAFDAQQQKTMDNFNSSWDAKIANAQSSIDRQKAGLDSAWEKRKDAAEKYWQARLDAIDSQIEAEQKAEERRQKMFDNEIARITRLNDLANRNIDFNVALNSGNLDEAAKIRNDAQAEDDQYILNKARDTGASKSDKRVEALNAQKDALEKQKDAAMKALDAQE
jgi:hypothetical protein